MNCYYVYRTVATTSKSNIGNLSQIQRSDSSISNESYSESASSDNQVLLPEKSLKIKFHSSSLHYPLALNGRPRINVEKRLFFFIVCLCFFTILILYLILTENININNNHLNIVVHHKFTLSICKQCLNKTKRIIAQEVGTVSSGQRNLPNCIIVGVRKCGTRALLEFLDIHPQIIKVTNEIHFFDDEKKYNLGLEWYRQQMPETNSSSQIVIEKTPAYFVTESVPERIYAMNSSIKIILIVRDPVTRLISDYAQLASNKAKRERQSPARIETFEQAVLFPNGKVNSSYKGIRISMYAVYFSRWIKLFSKNQIHVVDGDQFVYDPLPELQRIETFLGLSHQIKHQDFIYNITKGFYCIRLDDQTEKCLNKSKGRRHPDINPVVIRKLRKFYEPYNKYFFRLIGKSFMWPN